MSYGIRLRVWGELACFTRPEMKAERVSYDVITPSAARGILEAVYWKPAIRWVVERIHVLKPIRFTSVRRNELGCKIPVGNVKSAMRDLHSPLEVFIEDNRQQRAALVLRDVDYIIEARFEETGDEPANPGKHREMFERRARKGQCFHAPCLGCREFPASFAWPDDPLPVSELTGEKDLGWMLHDIDFNNDMQPRFFRAEMKNGIIAVPPFEGTVGG